MLVFYTTVGCHLCEQAEQLLRQFQAEQEFTWRAVDISSDPALADAYGIRIPVIKRIDTGAELGWPFELSALVEFMRDIEDNNNQPASPI